MSGEYKYKGDFGDKARAATRAAIEFKNTPVVPSCTNCTNIPAIRAVILFPNLGTPLILPPGEKKLNIFIAAEAKSREHFAVPIGVGFPQPAQLGYMYVDKHLRVYPIDGKAPKEDTKDGRLWNDGKVCSTAFKHVKVWCVGKFRSGTNFELSDIGHTHVANIRGSTIGHYNSIMAIHPDPKDPAAANVPLTWVYQIQIDLDSLPNKPAVGELVTLAWMVGLPDGYKKQKALAGMNDWEYQDKLVYDFLEGQKKYAKMSHYPDLYEFDVTDSATDKFPSGKSGISHRLKAWHPVTIGKKDTLKIGHLSDVHVNSRQFSLAASDACIVEGVSQKVGQKLTNCFTALKELFDNMKEAGADAIFLTGDLLDFNHNLDPREVRSTTPKDQWKYFDLMANAKNGQLYPRGIDDMLVFSLVRYSYETLKLPVYIITGNHDGYDIPFGISPRANGNVAVQAAAQVDDYSIIMPARLRAGIRAFNNREAIGLGLAPIGLAVAPVATTPLLGLHLAKKATALMKHEETDSLADILEKQGFSTDPNNIGFLKMNDGIPSDHNLTIYESCLIYGPTFAQTPKPFNFTPAQFDWFFTLLTPLADFRIDYKNQVMVGLDWGPSESMVKLDISIPELRDALGREDEFSKNTIKDKIMGAVMGLPRADSALTEGQKSIIEGTLSYEKTVMLFSHFTLINYDLSVPLSRKTEGFAGNDIVFNNYTKGTFSTGRDWLYSRLNGPIHCTVSGHSHRSALYRLDNRNMNAMTAIGYQPAEYKKNDPAAVAFHDKHFHYRGDNLTRVMVSSCGGPIGIQNFKGELYGWNLTPPSGTIIDVSVRDASEFQRVIASKYKAAKPRFCVVLDCVNNQAKQEVVRWEPKFGMDAGHFGHYQVRAGEVLEGAAYVDKMMFHVWDGALKKFVQFTTMIAPVPIAGLTCFYDMWITNHGDFFDLAAVKKVNGLAAPIFAQIDFNHALATNPLYSQYNFDDPWIFRIEVLKKDGRYEIKACVDEKAEVPDWDWLSLTFPGRYSPAPTWKRSSKSKNK